MNHQVCPGGGMISTVPCRYRPMALSLIYMDWGWRVRVIEYSLNLHVSSEHIERTK